RQVIRVMVHIVPIGHLRRAPMPTSVMRDHAIPLAQKEHHLVIPVIRRKRPAMTEHDRLPRTPVLVKDLNAVLGGNSRHTDSFDSWINTANYRSHALLFREKKPLPIPKHTRCPESRGHQGAWL